MRESLPALIALGLMATVGPGSGDAHASCNYGQDLDLRVTHSEIFRYLPISDQGKVGVCYAHAAATLIDFYRMKLKSDRAGVLSTHPIDAAQAGTLQAQDGDMEGGHICDVVDGMVKRGVGYVDTPLTTRQILDLGLQTQVQAVNRVYVDYLGEGSKNFKPVDPKFFPATARKKLTPGQKRYLERMDGVVAWVRAEIVRRGITTPRTDAEIYAFLQDNHVRNDYASFPVKFEMWIAGDGRDRPSFRMPHLACKRTTGLYDGNSYLGDLDRALDYQHVPVGIDLCSNILTSKSYRGYADGGKLKADCRPHAVLVIGKRFGRQGCEYLIRNSWGSGYSGYAWPVDQGDVWVPEFALTSSLFGTSIIR